MFRIKIILLLSLFHLMCACSEKEPLSEPETDPQSGDTDTESTKSSELADSETGSPARETDGDPTGTDWTDQDSADQDSADQDSADQDSASDAAGNTPFRLGNFLLHYEDGTQGQMQLRVIHQDEPERPIWETIPGRPFVLSRLVKTEFKEKYGSVSVDDSVRKRCTDHAAPSVIASRQSVTFTAGFYDCNASFTLTFEAKAEGQLGFELQIIPESPPVDSRARWRAILVYATSPDEGFFGFGEQFTYLNIKGQKLPVIVQEQGHGRGLQPLTGLLNTLGGGAGGSWHTSYATVPHYITNKNRSLFLENYEYSVFDLTAPSRVEVAVHASLMTGRILHGASPLDLVEEFTNYAGRMPPLPEWMGEGAVLGLMGGSDIVRERVQTLLDHGTPVSVLWTQDWVGQRTTLLGSARLWWNWEIDRTVYPDWENLIAEMNARGIRMMAYISTFLTDTSNNPNHRTNLFEEAKENGYLLVKRDGQPVLVGSGGFSGGMIDLSNPNARRWFKDIIKREMIDRGLAGWMADFGEAVPFDSVPFSGESPQTFHNRYPEEWAIINREIVEENGLLGQVVPFVRSGFTRSPRHSLLFWLGDQLTSWDHFDGIKTALTGLLSSGLSGYAINHSDIGGLIEMSYKPVVEYRRSKELLERWIELNAFTPVYRNHEGNNPDSGGHQIYSDSETMTFFARFAKIFAALNDYRMTLMKDATEKGYPVVRHPLLHYPNDPAVWEIEYQFMLGSDFMIAPVLDEGEKTVEVYLPAGFWIHAFTGTRYGSKDSGSFVTIDAPLGTPAVLYLEQSPWGSDFARKLAEQGLI